MVEILVFLSFFVRLSLGNEPLLLSFHGLSVLLKEIDTGSGCSILISTQVLKSPKEVILGTEFPLILYEPGVNLKYLSRFLMTKNPCRIHIRDAAEPASPETEEDSSERDEDFGNASISKSPKGFYPYFVSLRPISLEEIFEISKTKGTTDYNAVLMHFMVENGSTRGPHPSWCLSCGFCNTDYLPKSAKVGSNKYPSPTMILKICQKASNGRGQLVYFESDASLKADMFRKKQTYLEDCELWNFINVIETKRCTHTVIMAWVLSKMLNVTLDAGSEITDYSDLDEDDSQVLALCVEKCQLTPETFLEGRSSTVLMEQELQYALYCKPSHKYLDPSWFVMLEPFDYGIWLTMLGMALLIAALYRNIRYAFDIFFMFLGQSGRMKWTRWVGGLLLLLSLLHQYYEGVETTKVTAPLNKDRIRTVRDLFANNYKFVLPDENAYEFGRTLVERRYWDLGLNYTKDNVVFSTKYINLYHALFRTWFGYMARFKWILFIGRKSLLYMENSGLFRHNRIGNVSCYAVRDAGADDDQYLFKRNSYYMARGELRDRAYFTLSLMHQSGIHMHWIEDNNMQNMRKAKIRKNCEAGGCSDGSYIPLSTNSAVKIVIFWHLITCAVALVVFLTEVRHKLRQAFGWIGKGFGGFWRKRRRHPRIFRRMLLRVFSLFVV